MNYTFATEINAPRERVAELAGNPENRKHWMEGLESDEPLSGTPGTPGATSRLVFKTGKVHITMIGTLLARNLPEELSERFEASNMVTRATTRFVVLAPHKTRYISEQAFHFKGPFNTLVGWLLQREFKNQTLRHMENFKRFAEQNASE
jgi:hypothetical protein